LSHLGWVELELLRAGADPRDAGQVTQHLQGALQSFDHCKATPAWRPAHARLNLAFDALRRKSLAEAREQLSKTEGLRGEPRLLGYRELLVAELALASGEYETALAHFATLAEHARETFTLELEWRALEGSARASIALGRRDDAIASFELAKRTLANVAMRLP